MKSRAKSFRLGCAALLMLPGVIGVAGGAFLYRLGLRRRGDGLALGSCAGVTTFETRNQRGVLVTPARTDASACLVSVDNVGRTQRECGSLVVESQSGLRVEEASQIGWSQSDSAPGVRLRHECRYGSLSQSRWLESRGETIRLGDNEVCLSSSENAVRLTLHSCNAAREAHGSWILACTEGLFVLDHAGASQLSSLTGWRLGSDFARGSVVAAGPGGCRAWGEVLSPECDVQGAIWRIWVDGELAAMSGSLDDRRPILVDLVTGHRVVAVAAPGRVVHLAGHFLAYSDDAGWLRVRHLRTSHEWDVIGPASGFGGEGQLQSLPIESAWIVGEDVAVQDGDTIRWFRHPS